MAIGLVGKKRGMSRIFTEDGDSIPVTVIQADPNRVTRVLTGESDGYFAVQVTFGSKRANRVNKARAGLFAKAGVEAGHGLMEFRLEAAPAEGLEPGAELKVDQFEAGQKVDVTGTTRGKGFAGVIKRHNFSMQDATHGNSLSHRAAGSTGQGQTPGHVFKGKKMAGHMGNVRRTVQNLEIVRVDTERNLILIRGAVPGAQGGDVIVRSTVKQRG